MRKTIYSQVTNWLIIWFAVMGSFIMLFDWKLSENYIIGSVYYLFFSIIVFYIYHDSYKVLEEHFKWKPIIILIGFFIFNFSVYYYINNYLITPKELLSQYSNVAFLKMNYGYLFSKSFEIMFQQIMILNLVVLLKEYKINLMKFGLIFFFLFSILGHIGLLKYQGLAFGLFYLGGASLAIFLFPYILLRVNYGFVYTYIIHWLFYTLAGLSFWIIFQ